MKSAVSRRSRARPPGHKLNIEITFALALAHGVAEGAVAIARDVANASRGKK
jgi:hypothetical protein